MTNNASRLGCLDDRFEDRLELGESEDDDGVGILRVYGTMAWDKVRYVYVFFFTSSVVAPATISLSLSLSLSLSCL
jgi:hypothetical protein